ncbi:MAG: hypothetical protein RBU37_01990 [Myxococcota bacterium]|jgi:hypothetical protein|nr:hypothetical protein [Myxococcota bacterium]
MTRTRILMLTLLSFAMGLLLLSCQATPEKEKEWFKTKIDKLQVLADKTPHLKLSVELKIKEFKQEMDAAGSDIEKLKAVNRRVDAYMTEIEKTAQLPPAPTTTGTTGGKIGAAPAGTGAPMPGTVAPMGTTGAPMPAGTTGAPMPAGTTGAPMPAGTTGVPGGKLGGTPPAGAPVAPVAPVPAPTAPAGSGGFGGN